ncbi:Surface antigen [Minicystis rosea]|nr:Surface antigen [Minicystis rosea]
MAALVCFPASADASTARGGAVVLDREALVAYVADSDNHALHQVNLSSSEVVTTPLACAPEQVVLLGPGRVAVSLRGCGRVVAVDVNAAGEGTVSAAAEVAAEPFGLAVTPDGDVLVTSAWGHALTALAGDTLAPRFTVDLAREPRAVVVSPDGRRAFVTHAVGDALSIVDLPGDGTAEPTAPRVARVATLGGRFRNNVERALVVDTLHPSAALAFAAVLNDEGTRLYVPHLAVQNGDDAVTEIRGTYGSVPVEEDTSVASVAVIEAATGETLGGRKQPVDKGAGRIRLAPGLGPNVAPAGAPSRQATAAALLGDALYVTSYGTGELVELDARSLDPALSPRRTIAVGDGPAGVDVDPRTGIAVVYNRFSHDLSVVSLGSGAVETIPVASDPLPAEVAAGRRLFHTERDRRLSRDGRACSACHPDGRDDGLVWKLGGGPRQTPILAGRLDHGPYGWLAKHARLADNMAETITRLGGSGLPKERLAELAAYAQRGLVAPPRGAREGDARVARGQRIFESESAGCGGCHVLAQGTSDRRRHDVGSRTKTDETASFRTPPLLFLAGSAPYFHDGRYATLEALLDDNLDRMGSTSQLSGPDREALLAFLRTL